MTNHTRLVIPALVMLLWLLSPVRSDEPKPEGERPPASAVDDFFLNEVWAKVGSQSCLRCHKLGGDAEESKFVLLDPQKSQGAEQAEAMKQNREDRKSVV